jgi:hypothetical protein
MILNEMAETYEICVINKLHVPECKRLIMTIRNTNEVGNKTKRIIHSEIACYY